MESLNEKLSNSKVYFKQQRLLQMWWIVLFVLMIMCVYAYINGMSIIGIGSVASICLFFLVLYT